MCCVYVYTRVCVFTCVACMYVWGVYVYMCVAFVYVCDVSLYMCLSVYIFVCVHICQCGVYVYLCMCGEYVCVCIYLCPCVDRGQKKSSSVLFSHTLPYSFDIGSLTKAGVRQGSGTVLFLPVHSWVFIWCWEFKLRPSCFYRVWFFPVSGLSQ